MLRDEWRRSHTGSRRDECDDWFIAMYADDFFFVGPPEIAAAEMTQRLRHAFAAFQSTVANVSCDINEDLRVNHYHDDEVFFQYGTTQIPAVMLDFTLSALTVRNRHPPIPPRK